MHAKAKNQAPVKIDTFKVTSSNYWYFPVILGFAILILYGQTTSFDYCGDDVLVTTGNQYVKQGFGGIKKIFSHSYMHGYTTEADPLYRPMPLLTYAIEGQLFGFSPKTHHVWNIIYYIFCCISFYYFLKKLQFTHIISFAIALLFTIHPLHTEVVSNIKSRDEILAFLGLLIMLNAYFNLKQSLLWKCIGVFGFFIALLSKEIALSFIAIPLLIDHFSFKTDWKILAKKTVPYLVTLGFFLIIRFTIDLSNTDKLTLLENSLMQCNGIIDRFPTAFYILFKYLVLFIFPFNLSYDYSYNQIPIQSYFSFPVVLCLLAFIGMVYYVFKYFKTTPSLAIGALWFLITISITSNIIFLTGATMAERFMFTPSAGISIFIFAVFLTHHDKIPFSKKYQTILYAIVLVLFSISTYTRNKVWKNDKELFISGIQSAPESARTNMFYGRYFYNEAKPMTNIQQKSILLDSAILYYQKALRIYPKFHVAHHFLGWAYREKNMKNEEKIAYKNAYESDTSYYPALISLSIAELKQENFIEAIRLLEKSKTVNENSYDTNYNLGLAFRGNKQYQEAISSYLKAHQINPAREEPISQLIKIYRDDLNKLDSALYYNELIKKIKR